MGCLDLPIKANIAAARGNPCSRGGSNRPAAGVTPIGLELVGRPAIKLRSVRGVRADC